MRMKNALLFFLALTFTNVVQAGEKCGDSALHGTWETTSGKLVTNRLIIKPDCTATLRTWSSSGPRQIDGQYLEFDWEADSDQNMWEVNHTYYIGCNFDTGIWEQLELSGGRQAYQANSFALMVGGVVYKNHDTAETGRPREGDSCTALYERD